MGLIPIIVVITLYLIILKHALRKIVHLKNGGEYDINNPHNLRIFRGRPQIPSPIATESDTPAKGFLAKFFKNKPSHPVNSPSKWKAIKVVLFTTSSFVVTWTPYFIASMIYVYQCQNINTKRCKNIRIIIASPLAILGFTNSLINPIIYAWWHKGFRDYVSKRVSVVMMRTKWMNNSIDHHGHPSDKMSVAKSCSNLSTKSSSMTEISINTVNPNQETN